MKNAERLVVWITAVGLVALSVVYFFSHSAPAMPAGWDYKDVFSLLLAFISAALTMLGILIAIAAFLSYQKITDLAAERAETASHDFLKSDAFQSRMKLLISEQMKNSQKDELEPALDVSGDKSGQTSGDGPDADKDQPWVDA